MTSTPLYLVEHKLDYRPFFKSSLIFQRYGNNYMSDANGFDDLSKREELNDDY